MTLADLILILAALLLWAGLVALALRGWRRRGARQSGELGEFPAVPAQLGEPLQGPDTGVYVGSTLAPTWTTRIAVGDYGDRAAVSYTRYAAGVLLARQGASDIWIPADAITALRTENRLAGKVMSRDGLLAIRWRLPSGVEIDSGIRGDDKSVYPDWTAPFAELTEQTYQRLAQTDPDGRPESKDGPESKNGPETNSPETKNSPETNSTDTKRKTS